jgi:hypothetical protein
MDASERDVTGASTDEADESDGPGPVASWGVAVVLVACLVGAPVAILLVPPTFVPYRDAYLGLALVPGLVLGALGVWTTLYG